MEMEVQGRHTRRALPTRVRVGQRLNCNATATARNTRMYVERRQLHVLTRSPMQAETVLARACIASRDSRVQTSLTNIDSSQGSPIRSITFPSFVSVFTCEIDHFHVLRPGVRRTHTSCHNLSESIATNYVSATTARYGSLPLGTLESHQTIATRLTHSLVHRYQPHGGF